MTETINLDLLDDWAFNILELYNYNITGPYNYWYRWLQSTARTLKRPLSIVEIGVYRGRTLIPTAHLASLAHPESIVYGFDTFEGFPPDYIDERDDIQFFQRLHDLSIITKQHMELVELNRFYLEAIGRSTDVLNLSTSSNFSKTSLDIVNNRLKMFCISNCRLFKGAVEETIPTFIPERIDAVFLDSDLYLSYKHTLPYLFSRLSDGGFIFLDEYYSLKFPGPRYATFQFIHDHPRAKLLQVSKEPFGFERWILTN